MTQNELAALADRLRDIKILSSAQGGAYTVYLLPEEMDLAEKALRASAPAGVREALKYDDVLIPFVSMMRAELHANTGKGDRPGWLQMDRKTGLLEIFYHLAKLQKAVKDNDPDRIREFGADVANMSMMLVDVCGALPDAGTVSPVPSEWNAAVEAAAEVVSKRAATIQAHADTHSEFPGIVKGIRTANADVLRCVLPLIRSLHRGEAQRTDGCMGDPSPNDPRNLKELLAMPSVFERSSDTAPQTDGNQPSTKSAPPLAAPHNSGERDPSVMPDWCGADTSSQTDDGVR